MEGGAALGRQRVGGSYLLCRCSTYCIGTLTVARRALAGDHLTLAGGCTELEAVHEIDSSVDSTGMANSDHHWHEPNVSSNFDG